MPSTFNGEVALPFLSNVRKEEMRLQISHPQVLINLPGDFSEDLVKTNMQTLLKIAVTRVTKQGLGSFLFTLSDHLDLKKALEFWPELQPP